MSKVISVYICQGCGAEGKFPAGDQIHRCDKCNQSAWTRVRDEEVEAEKPADSAPPEPPAAPAEPEKPAEPKAEKPVKPKA